MKRTLILPLLLLIGATLWGQEMSVQAPKQVYAGDNFTVTFVVNDNADNFKGPTFKGFSLRAGPQIGSQSYTSIVNGRVSSSVNTTFTYRLLADVEGTFTIGPASCTVKGKKVTSESFSIKVEKMSQAQQQQRQQQRQRQQQSYDPWDQQPQPASKLDDNMLFARATVNKTNPYQGEQVIITYKVYTRVPISQYGIEKLPGNKGFWAEDLSANQKQVKESEETIGNLRYRVYEIRKGALFAQENGTLTIDPLNLNVLAVVQTPRRRTGSIWDIFDDPFFNTAQAVERTLRTKAVNVNVRKLPDGPDNFSGAVGNFTVKGGLNMDKVKANEAISYRLTVNGSGNLMLITPPQPEFPASFEVYDPQIEDNIHKGDNGVSGSRTYEWVLIPRSQGHFTIPAYQFVYFDPATSKYVTLSIDEQQVEVEKGDATTTAASKDDVKLLNSDINYIHPVNRLRPTGDEGGTSLAFILLAILIPLLTVAAILVGRKYLSQADDVVGMRKKRATRMARRRLKKAAAYLGTGDTDRFYEEIYKAIWGCLSDKYSIPHSQLNRDTVSACLEEKQVPAEQQERIMKVLQDVDLARFAPGDPEAQKQTIYTEALVMIAEL